MVEVVTPDGTKELWAVAALNDRAVTIVQQHVPPGSAIYPTHVGCRLAPRCKVLAR